MLDNSHFLPTLLARKDPRRSATVFQTHQPIKRLCKGLDLLLLLPRVTCEQWKCWTHRMSNVLPHGLVMANWKTVEVETYLDSKYSKPFTRHQCGQPLEKNTPEEFDMCLLHLRCIATGFQPNLLRFNLQQLGNLEDLVVAHNVYVAIHKTQQVEHKIYLEHMDCLALEPATLHKTSLSRVKITQDLYT